MNGRLDLLRPWQRRALAAAPAALILILAASIVVSLRRQDQTEARVRHTMDVRLELEQLIGHLADAETGQRGYLLSGDTTYLAPYVDGLRDLDGIFARLDALVEEDDAQATRLDRVRSLTADKLVELDRTLDLARAGDIGAALALVRGDSGQVLMDSIRTAVERMTAREAALLAQRSERARRAQQLTMLLVAAGLPLLLLIALLTNGVLRRNQEKLEHSAHLLEEQNVELEEQATEAELLTQQLQEQAVELEMQSDELRATADELQQRSEIAEQANETKVAFLRTMSHELRTPLNAIGGYAELLELGVRGPLTDQQRDDIGRIRRSQRHLLALINDILNFARLDAGRVTYEIRSVALREVIDRTEELVRPQIEMKEITFALDEVPDVHIAADPDKAQQILVNLISNATRFTDRGGRIACAVDVEDDCVLVRVRDTGVGIPPERITQIFEPFVQVHRTLSAAIDGTGLGLSISRDLARAMHGDITVESEVGVGSTFTVSFPTADWAGLV